MRIGQRILIVVPVVAGLFLLLVGCSDTTPEGQGANRQQVAARGTIPDQVIYNSDIMLTEEGVKKVLIESAYLEKYAENDSTILSDIHATFFDSLGHTESVLEADSGLVREKTDWLKVWGHVSVVSEDGVHLQADSLFWDQRTNMITTESFVRITRDGSVQSGYGLRSNSSLTEFQIKRGVRGRFDNVDEIRQRKPVVSDSTKAP